MSTDQADADLGADERRALADRLAGAGALSARWRETFEAVPRHLFLPPVYWEFVEGSAVPRDRGSDPDGWLAGAYRDTPAITQWDDGDEAAGRRDFTSSLSMPTMVALMLGDLDVEDGHRVREVGTGPGYNAALLAHRLGAERVMSVEIDRTVADLARANLAAAGLGGLRVLTGDGAQPDTGGAEPADRLIATCASLVTDVPAVWLDQTRPGGLIVAPSTTLFGGGAVARLRVADDHRSASGRFTGSSDFMRMRQQRYQAPPVDAYLPGDWPGDAEASATGLDPEAIRASWLAQFAIGCRLPDLYYRRAPYGDTVTWWFFDTAVTSWATVDSVPGAVEFDVRQSGPRRLWDEIHAAWTAWEQAEHPGYERYGLTVTGSGERTVWLDDPDHHWSPPAR
ncbi:protein-L-isoaspartate(D-aspartate) O-methyltransferase [Streptomyces sp. BE20]|uniref:protein-L-isoaspartate(D-aspartate) O-methyltransferase n=1 Tax=Streptomyces sp. BE20 TaxID=3002525 RepID=UPI002E7843AA|nr:protein-L-isoaspartate(D-aspartate) O-methyltransferase [Streptomyces sp. BE20]MEE1824093.1 protein-L-isoaspartate(D-aspartate) O-methyltransferase [Streptomyces sp. BE20]